MMAMQGQIYGARFFGIEYQQANVDWATTFLPPQHTSCSMNAFDLSPFPANSFDAIVSYAALYHLKREEQCKVMHDMIRIVKPTRKIWIGWIKIVDINTYEGTNCDFWAKCLADAPVSIECGKELEMYGATAYGWDIHASLYVTKL